MSGAVVTQEAPAGGSIAPLSVGELTRHVTLVQQVMKEVMREGEHYGRIPGCGEKPSLFKPGAEKLGFTFGLVPSFLIDERQLEHGHREYRITCQLRTRDGSLVGDGVGTGSTMETKYRYRQGERSCPKCGKATIIKGKEEYGGGWLCFPKKGGCGAKWSNGAAEIEGQQIGRVENPDPADCYNTVLKMAKKRAHVDAIITATAASDIFTQDLEDMESRAERHEAREAATAREVQVKEEAPPRPKAEAAGAAGTGNATTSTNHQSASTQTTTDTPKTSATADTKPAAVPPAADDQRRELIRMGNAISHVLTEGFYRDLWRETPVDKRYSTVQRLYDALGSVDANEALEIALEGGGSATERAGMILTLAMRQAAPEATAAATTSTGGADEPPF